jgi:hypothetical protein
MKNLFVILTVVAGVVAPCPGLGAQTITATISGTVTDPQGAAVPGAIVSVISNETGLKKTVNTDDQGRYTVLFLRPGLYSVTVEAAGFSANSRSQVRLEVAQVGTLDFQLTLATAQQAIQVAAEAAPLLDSESGGLENAVETKLIQDLPSAERSTLALINNLPGVVDTGFAFAAGENLNTNGNAQGPIGTPGNRNIFDSLFSIGGGQASTNDVLLDGVSNTFGDFNGMAISPPQDSVHEFEVLSGVFSAEYGRSGGGVLLFMTKAGGAKFHGTLYEYFQNGGLNANGWQRNRAGYASDGVTPALPRIPIKRNQFGGSVGGPAVFPRLGRSQNTFFFFNYEGRREDNPFSKDLTVPTAKMRTGDLSELLQPVARANVPLNADGSQPLVGQIYDPYGPLVRNPSGTMVRNTILGNRLDLLPKCNSSGPRQAACLDPIGQELSYLPLPNQPGVTNNYLYSATTRFTRDLMAARLDKTLSEKHSLFGRFSLEKRFQGEPNFLKSVAANSLITRAAFFNITLNDVFTLTARAINNFRYGCTGVRTHQILIAGEQNFDPTTVGFPTYIRDFASTTAFPVFNFSGSGPQSLGVAGEITSGQIGGGGSDQPRQTHTLANAITWMRRGHTIKSGVEYRLMRNFSSYNTNPTGSYTFDRTFTRGPVPTSSPAVGTETGSSLASLFLGLPASGTIHSFIPVTLYHHYAAAFFQDDWKIHRRLTLNLGLRWEVETGTAETHGQMTRFELAAKSHLNGVVGMPADATVRALRANFTDLRGLLSFADAPETSTNFLGFAPRVGFAYRPNEKTVVRGGYGISFVPGSMVSSSASGLHFDTALLQSSDALGQVIQAGGTAAGTVFLTDLYPNGLRRAPGRSLGPNTLIGQSPYLVDPNRPLAYLQQCNLTIQRMLPKKFVVQLTYVGSHGVHLQIPWVYINQLPPAMLDYARQNYATARDVNGATAANTTQFFSQQVSNPFYGIVTDPNSVLASRTVRRAQLLKPFPQYDNPYFLEPRKGASKYNAFQTGIRKSYSNGLSLLTSYSLSKLIDISYTGRSNGTMAGARVQDAYNFAGDYSLSNVDIPHRLTASFSYEFPFGQGRAFGRKMGAVRDKLLGGFQVSGSVLWQSGTPVAVSAPSLGSTLSYYMRHADRLAGVSARTPGGQMHENIRNGGFAFNPSAYAQPADFTLGNAARTYGDTRRDTYKNVNLSLLKNFSFGDGRHKLQPRGEFLNAFNMVVFGTPGTDVSNRDVVQNGVFGKRGTFARVTTQGNQPRIIQLVLRHSF